MAAAVIVELPDTSTTAINKKLDELREQVGAVNLGRVLTLVIAPGSDALLEESIEAAIADGNPLPRTLGGGRRPRASQPGDRGDDRRCRRCRGALGRATAGRE